MTTTIIDGKFGAERVPVHDLTDPSGVPPQRVAAEVNRVPFDDARVATQPGFSEARQARTQRENQPDSSIIEGIGAAISGWDTTRLIRRLSRPAFEDDTPVNQFEYLQEVPIQLTADEREYFLDVGKGTKSAAYAMQQIQDRRLAQRVAGDHPVAGLATAFVDPLWLVVPPGIRLGATAPRAGRAISAVTAGALGAGVTALGEGPVSDEEIAMSMLMNAAAGTALYSPGKGVVQADPTFPSAALQSSLDRTPKPRYKLGPDGQPYLLPETMQPHAVNTEAAKVVTDVDTVLSQDAKARGLGHTLQWNMHKTMSSFGDTGKKIANLIYDNNSDLSITSIEAHREAILGDLRTLQYAYEDQLRKAMGDDGFGTAKMVSPLHSRQAYQAQNAIEVAVQRELFRREQAARTGVPIDVAGVPERISKMADALDALHKRALAEMKASGVAGAADLDMKPGYLNRRWSSLAIDDAIGKFEQRGLSREAAHGKIVDLVALSVRRANQQMDQKLAKQIGKAIVDRAQRKGYFEDSMFNTPAGEGQLKEMRDVLKGGGMSHADIERALDILRVQSDDAGKSGFMKHRMDIDYKATVRIGDENISVMDLIDNRVNTIVDQYVSQVATQSAMARKGLTKRSDIEALREELLHSVPVERREEAKDLFDNTIAHFRGDPAGAKVNQNFRLMQSYGRSISLAWSGLWQLTEFATAMGEYGLVKSMKYAMQEIPGFKQLMSPSKDEARALNNVLAEHSAASMRLRPYIAKFEDGYDMDMTSALQLSAQTAGQLVPYANAMKFVHHSQARVVGNLILDRLEMASNGNKKAQEALAKYGLEAPVMNRLAAEIRAKGLNIDAWDDKVWADVRPAFAKMMDAAVLRGRLGDVPAFAAFDSVGKFIFTYRTFVLTAHNKVLAGGMERNGAGAVGLIMLYQFPLALAAVQAQSVIAGKGTLSTEDMTKKALGQMGGLGLFSEPLKWATGESNSVGAPALIPLDRGVKLFQAGAQGDPKQATSTTLTMLPVISAVPFVKGMANQIKE